MVKIYTQLVIAGYKKLEQVPAIIREQVKSLLELAGTEKAVG